MPDQPVTDFSLPTGQGSTFTLSQQRGRIVVLYFYPKDNTPGCTTESADFREHHADFTALGARIVGVSRDSVASHARFAEKLGLPFDLLSDAEETLCTQFAVIKQKKMYGRDVRGIERSTFLIDGTGVLRQAWRGVKVPGHVAAVLAAVRTLASGA